MHFIEQGSGTCVLFLHGWGGNCYSFYQQFCILSKTYHCIAVDFPGFGNTSSPDVPYTVKDYALELQTFLQQQRIEKLHIIAHSFGGRVAAVLFQQIPQKILSMVFVDIAGVKPKRGLRYKTKVFQYKCTKWLVKHGLCEKQKLEKFGSTEYKELSPCMKQTFIYVVNENLKTYFQKITCPVLLVWGSQDKDTPLYMAKRLNKWIKNSKLVVFKNASHFSYLKNPVRFESYVDAFLKGKL